MTSSPEAITADLIAAQLGNAYDSFDAADRSLHVEMLQSIGQPGDVALHAGCKGEDRWTVTICTSDAIGALSMIAGLFAAYRLDILEADIFTVRFAGKKLGQQAMRKWWQERGRPALASPPPSRRLLDVFHIRSLADTGPELWSNFRADLHALVHLLVSGQREKARDAIVDRVSEAFRAVSRTDTKMFPMAVELINEPSLQFTTLTVESTDAPGFLFAFTNALAGFTVNIERAEIRTLNGEAHDIFRVTDVGGRPITSENRIHELQVATALVKQFTYLLPRSPDPGLALRQFNALISQMLSRPNWTEELSNLWSLSVLETLADLMGVSRFLWEDFLRMQHENLFPVLLDVPSLKEPRSMAQLREDLVGQLGRETSQAGHVAALNAFKDREMFRIDLRHITGRSEFAAFAGELSQLAEVTVETAAEITQEALQTQFGTPILPDGRDCPWCICALGKFGGGELGFGSDLELVFLYEGEGATNGPTVILNSEYFWRFVQTFQSILIARQEGIFEIDLRLRPYGSAGALACRLDGFAQYYSEQGDAEHFERMALVRMRRVAGDIRLGARALSVRDSFIYSGRPLDIENILHLRHRQATELVPQGQISAKHSPGGLVDVEYFVQAWQIAAGYADPAVRVTNTIRTIELLNEHGYIGHETASTLRDSYNFLRQLIDALRVVRDNAKDLAIPPESSREFNYLAHRLRFDSPSALQEAINSRMSSACDLWANSPPPPLYVP